MSKQAAIIYGPNGAGKGTQANLLAWKKGFIHFDTGKYLEQFVHEPKNQNDPVVQEERKNFDTGLLCSPPFVLKLVREKTQEVSRAGFGIVYSGSPRTIYEAFGDGQTEGLIATLEKEYGKANIKPFFLEIDPKESIKRNKVRLVCSKCRTGVMYVEGERHTMCPICGGPLEQRTVDKPEVLETRIKEYTERTLPILKGLEGRGYKIIKIDATPLPYKVHEEILRHIS